MPSKFVRLSSNVRWFLTMSDNVRKCLTMFDNVWQCPKMSGNVRRHFRTCYDMSQGYFRQYPALYLEMIFHGPDYFNGTDHDQCTNHINSAARSTSAKVPEPCTRYVCTVLCITSVFSRCCRCWCKVDASRRTKSIHYCWSPSMRVSRCQRREEKSSPLSTIWSLSKSCTPEGLSWTWLGTPEEKKGDRIHTFLHSVPAIFEVLRPNFSTTVVGSKKDNNLSYGHYKNQ